MALLKGKKHKAKLNWYFIVFGLLAILVGIGTDVDDPKLKNLTIDLSSDVVNIKGSKGEIDYAVWTKQYKNRFIFYKGSINKGEHDAISNLKAGQRVNVLITTSDFRDLSDENEDIVIRGLSRNGKYLLTREDFLQNRKYYKLRWSVILIFTGILLFLNGLNVLSKKTNYIAIGLFAGIFVLLRIFEVGIYR